MTKSDGEGMSDLARLLAFLARLEEEHVYYSLCMDRPEALMVSVTVPGQRWEVEFMNDGSIEVERFRSNGQIDRLELDGLMSEIRQLMD
jgi:hypothetical protein